MGQWVQTDRKWNKHPCSFITHLSARWRISLTALGLGSSSSMLTQTAQSSQLQRNWKLLRWYANQVQNLKTEQKFFFSISGLNWLNDIQCHRQRHLSNGWRHYILTAKCKTAATSLLMHWSYCGFYTMPSLCNISRWQNLAQNDLKVTENGLWLCGSAADYSPLHTGCVHGVDTLKQHLCSLGKLPKVKVKQTCYGLTDCGLVMPYGDTNLGQHWFR